MSLSECAGFESLESFLNELWPASLRRLKETVSPRLVSPGGRFGLVGFTDKVHYLTILRRPREE